MYGNITAETPLLYAVDFVGIYPRRNIEAAVRKCKRKYALISNGAAKKSNKYGYRHHRRKGFELAICDADSDVLFESEKAPLTAEEYRKLKALGTEISAGFSFALYDSVPDKNAAAAPERKTFYGKVPRSADEMDAHTKI